MELKIEIRNQEAVRAVLAKLSGKEAREAYAKALNDTGFQVRREMQKALRRDFDRVTPWIERSPKVFKATADKLTVSIAPTLSTTNRPGTGGKVGVDPQDVLQAQEFGGRRRDKKSESALRRAGILPAGMQTAIPREPFPGSDDGKGNLRGAFLQQLLSYLQAYSEQGYKANATARRKAGIQRGTARTAGRRYFVTYGRMRDGRQSNLPAGVWAATGTTGAIIKPVLIFTRPGTYKPRISMSKIAAASLSQDYLDSRVRYRIRQAAGI